VVILKKEGVFMLNKSILTLSVIGLTIISSGCNNNDAATGELFHDNGNTINVSDREELYNNENDTNGQDRSRRFGYVRHQKSPIMGENISTENMYTLDREKVADSISKMSVSLPKVDDCATLVTGEEVLISYKTGEKDEKARFEVADQVKKTALSVVPRWYHVYVTDDPALMRDVENLASMGANVDNAGTAIGDTIDLMLESSPQGRNVDAGENPNGEMIGDKYELQDDDVHGTNRQKRNDTTGD
jgi:Sporulation lipoprotein YhcN/YlaJ (Spore_YhcN_YlaJ)